tara:strand:+ start:267344 stop:268621 length:1278 start_codon:yes stop_codon:yes gene_type:complete
MRYLYSALLYCLVPVLLLRLLWRSRLAPAYRRRIAERFGWFDAPAATPEPTLWVHAVSVGETLAAAPLIESLLQRYPQHRMIITTTTPTGSDRVKALFGERVFHVYCPWDLPGAVQRFLRRTDPDLLLLMETELWPNLLHHCQARGCRVILANARLSRRSARGYARVGALTGAMLQQIDAVACQSAPDGRRFLALGLPAAALQLVGNIKFDLNLDQSLREQAAATGLRIGAPERPVLVAASTHEGEDEVILNAFAELRPGCPDCLLLLVPRHPERFDKVAQLVQEAGWRMVRRSQDQWPTAEDDVLLGDTMGELLALLGCATIAVVGGSFVERGGHNVLEPAAWGVPVVTGPHVFNFAQVSALLENAGAMMRLPGAQSLGACLVELLQDASRRASMGAAGQRVVAENCGARDKLLALVQKQLDRK